MRKCYALSLLLLIVTSASCRHGVFKTEIFNNTGTDLENVVVVSMGKTHFQGTVKAKSKLETFNVPRKIYRNMLAVGHSAIGLYVGQRLISWEDMVSSYDGGPGQEFERLRIDLSTNDKGDIVAKWNGREGNVGDFNSAPSNR